MSDKPKNWRFHRGPGDVIELGPADESIKLVWSRSVIVIDPLLAPYIRQNAGIR